MPVARPLSPARAFAGLLFAFAIRVPAQTLRSVRCEGATRHYLLTSPLGNAPKPALLLLHGAGGHAADLLPLWMDFAANHGIVLVAPELPRDAAFEEVAPAVFRCIVEDAKTAAKIDPRRIYVFGHSMGGYLAYDAAMFESEYFAAVAVHAAGIADDYTAIVARARRKIPIAIFVGDRDAPGTLQSARRTQELLRREGFPVEYEELEGHDHNFDAFAERITRDAWGFLSARSLP